MNVITKDWLSMHYEDKIMALIYAQRKNARGDGR